MVVAKVTHLSPSRIILTSFALAIFIGFVLLSLSESRTCAIPLIDILFTSVSSVCVTGIDLVPMASFSSFGKMIILCLIQIGGVGLMTLSFFFASLFLNLGIASRFIAGQILDFDRWGKIRNFLILIISITFIFELLGACLLYPFFHATLPVDQAIFHALFYSVSAFCNAGITLTENSLISQNNNYIMLSILGSLVFAGGIGFVVWYELLKTLKKKLGWGTKTNLMNTLYSLHLRMVMYMTTYLTLISTILFWLLERNNLLKDMTLFQGFFNSLFSAISLRSSGFRVVDLSHARPATLFMIIVFMFIGASPSSTGGGIKTVAALLFVATLFSIIKNKEDVELFGRTIPTDQVYKAISIVCLAAFWVIGTTFLLLLLEPKFSLIQILFEAAASFSTCGLSTGIIREFSLCGKLILIINMFIGRIGALTLILALRRKPEKQLYHYPEERVIIG